MGERGMLSALGFRFLDENGLALDGKGGNLSKICSVDSSAVPDVVYECRFTVACDVDTPFCGPVGASVVFAPQKGADSRMVENLDRGMAFLAFLGAVLKRGVDMVLDAIGFDEALKDCDLVITGEGRMDYQTPKGKTPSGVLERAMDKDFAYKNIVRTVSQIVRIMTNN